MSLRLLQVRAADGQRGVAALDDTGVARKIKGSSTTYELAQAALKAGKSLADTVAAQITDEKLDLEELQKNNRLLAPIDHPDSAHLYVTGTGLTHLGSAEGRDKMHKAAAGGTLTDSMRMFKMGLDGGKPAAGQVGAQPEWFYKGDGSALVGTGVDIPSPDFAQDGGEKPEIAGIYIIDANGNPRRLGFCLGNEFSDHITERGNYLWLAHSKLRYASLGPELLTGDLPADVQGTSRLIRDGKTLWEKPFLTGEDNMSHTLANLEHHHFKYKLFRRPGDVHVHFYGTATLSFSDGIQTQFGDVFEITAPQFKLPLRNTLARSESPTTSVKPL